VASASDWGWSARSECLLVGGSMHRSMHLRMGFARKSIRHVHNTVHNLGLRSEIDSRTR
jgi:hypothetical protein